MPVEGPSQPYTWASCSGCACPNHHIPIHISKDEDDNSPTDFMPDFNHLECSNDPPLPGEVGTLRSTILDSEKTAAAIDQERKEMMALKNEFLKGVDLLEKQTSILRHKRLALNERIRERKALLSPVRRLPPEVLVLIFHETIEFPWKRINANDDWRCFDLDRQFDADSPWSIASVSRRWREVSLSFPELWAFINIAVTEELFEEGEYGYLRFINLHLSRSGSRPLSVAIYKNGDLPFEELPPNLLGSLFSFVHRIHHLHVHLSQRIISSLHPLRSSFHQLRTLLIAPVDDEIQDDELEIFDYSLELHTITTINTDFSLLFVSWRNITRYESDYYPTEKFGLTCPESLLQNLRGLTNLTSCFWRCGPASCEDGLADIEEPIACQKLQSLEIGSGHLSKPEAISQVIDRLHLPSLSSLRVTCPVKGCESDVQFGSITRLIGRSWCKLTTLAFSKGAVPSDDLHYIFDQTPTLEEVKLVDVGSEAITDELLATLVYRDSDTKPLLPRLRSLYLGGSFAFTMCMYACMIESRWKCASQFSQVCRLKSVTLRKDVNVQLVEKEKAICLAVLAPLRSEGLGLDVRLQVSGSEEENDDDDDTESSRDD
ncbi:hypothetical protein EDD18DRAFT_1332974 [Armillaria luteobubalina]|uniref:F-box domain-containing protein n=1 Tax=Armillaria luteobubalina TaxID=153913 RepID=A0AA39Q570_9AGAR|nr:hypothetical protein EDD18DRAFT_1332974 [Armillaria luteobubalina]